MPPKLEHEVEALTLNIEGLLKLLGGTPAQRERFFEEFKGLTTPAQYGLATELVRTINTQLTSAKAGLTGAYAAAKESQRVAA